MAPASGSPLTAVICDDDPVARKLVRSVVERAGYTVLAGVDTAIDALNLVLAHKPHVLVLDLVLPGMPGEDILDTLRESSDTHVIVHTAHDPRFAVKRGARLFVSKGQLGLLERTLERLAGEEISAAV